jgi:formate/nitrite transporter FocA (FNT family)
MASDSNHLPSEWKPGKDTAAGHEEVRGEDHAKNGVRGREGEPGTGEEFGQDETRSKSEARREKESEAEARKIEEHSALRVGVIYEAIRAEGEDELGRSSSALAWSGLAAGLSMGFSLVLNGLLRNGLPPTDWRPLVAKLGYTAGFVIVILGRQQLFTENTLTVILPLLNRKDWSTLRNVLRLWTVVLLSNLIGALAFAWVVGNADIFAPDRLQRFTEVGLEAAAGDFGHKLLTGIFGGWLIALMVWLLPGAEASRFWVIIFITYIVGLGDFSHVIAGSVEVLFLVTTGSLGWGSFLGNFLLPALLGNIIGGVSLVALLSHAQVVAGGGRQHE